MERATKKRKAEAQQWLQNQNPSHVDETLAIRFAARFSHLSAKVLRDLLLSSSRSLAPLVEGVRQENFHELERTLLTLAAEYANGDATRQRQVRQLVISARQHAEWVVRNPRVAAPRREMKTEMVLWLRTWLENPAVFDIWVQLRKHTCGGAPDAL